MKTLIKHILAIITIFALISFGEAQQQKTQIVKNIGDYFYQVANNGTMVVRQKSLFNENQEDLINIKLLSVDTKGKKSGSEDEEQIKELTKNFKDVTWTVSEKDGKISLKSGNFILSMISEDKKCSLTEDAKCKDSRIVFEVTYEATIEGSFSEIISDYQIQLISRQSYDYHHSTQDNKQTFWFSDVDYLSFNVEESNINKNGNIINIKRNKGTQQIIYHIKAFDSTKDEVKSKKDDRYSLNYNGGVFQIQQPLSKRYKEEYYMRNFHFMPLRLFTLNETNQIIPENYYYFNVANASPKLSEGASTDSIVQFNTYELKRNDITFNQKINIYTEDQKVQNFTNQENLSNNTAFYNLGMGENIISRGDIVVEQTIGNACYIPESEKAYKSCKHFVYSFEVEFEANINQFYTFASLKNTDAKIESITINNKNQSPVNQNFRNIITVTTTPFEKTANLKILFKVVDNSKRLIVYEQSPEHEKIVFQNAGGVLLYTNTTWNVNDNMNLDHYKFKSIRLNSIEEEVGKIQVREIITKGTYYNLISSNQNMINVTSDFLEEDAKVSLIFENSFKNGTNVEHRYINDKGENIKENITLNERQVYVHFEVNDWKYCTEKDTRKACKKVNSDNVFLKFYANEIIHHIEEEAEESKALRLLQKKPDPVKPDDDDQKEKKIINVNFKELKGNYKSFKEEKIDNLDDYAETEVKFNFGKAAFMNGGFIISYNENPFKPTEESNYTALIIILVVVAFLLICAAVGFFIRRGKLRRASEDARRLHEGEDN